MMRIRERGVRITSSAGELGGKALKLGIIESGCKVKGVLPKCEKVRRGTSWSRPEVEKRREKEIQRPMERRKRQRANVAC